MSNQYPPPQGYPPPPGGGYPPPQGGGGYGGGGYGGGYPPPPGGKTKTMNMDYNVAAMLCYLPTCLCCVNVIFSIIWLASEPRESRFVRFHAIQGLLLVAAGIVVWIVFTILRVILGVGSMMPFGEGGGSAVQLGVFGLSAILGLIQLGVGLVFLVVHIVGCVKAYQNQYFKLPVIGGIADSNV